MSKDSDLARQLKDLEKEKKKKSDQEDYINDREWI